MTIKLEKDMRLKVMGLALMLGSVVTTAAQAHHSLSILDITKPVAVKGVLRTVEFKNPHSHFTLDIKNDKGEAVTWDFESLPPAGFRQAEIKKSDFTQAIGQEVTINGFIARDGSPRGLMMKMTFADGKSIAVKISR